MIIEQIYCFLGGFLRVNDNLKSLQFNLFSFKND